MHEHAWFHITKRAEALRFPGTGHSGVWIYFCVVLLILPASMWISDSGWLPPSYKKAVEATEAR